MGADRSISLAAHAADRLTFGARPDDVRRIGSIGYEAFLEEQLNPESIDDSEADALLASLPHDTLLEDWAALFDRLKASPSSEVTRPFYEVRHATWARLVHSKKQLFERTVNFWYDHFNIYGPYSTIRSLFPKWDVTIRTHALGNFHDLLVATAMNPCMLRYLDNYKSTDGGPNENYARELIELHTLGAMNYNTPDGYRDDDVYETSRCLTGWSYDSDSESPTRGQFAYDHGDHDRFQKYVLGLQIPRDQPPLQDGLDVLERLAFHPGTARHIAWKLCARFISESPPQSIVDSTAEVFQNERESADQIRKTLAHILSSDEFMAARGAKFKRPLDWMVSFMRILEIPYFDYESFNLNYYYNPMGHEMFGWKTPDGAPDEAEYWATSNNFIRRWRFAMQTADDRFAKYGFVFASTVLLPSEIETPRQIADWFAGRILNGSASAATMASLVDFLADGRNPELPLSQKTIDAKAAHLAAMCTATPEFMRR